jgi:hypothetical protein
MLTQNLQTEMNYNFVVLVLLEQAEHTDKNYLCYYQNLNTTSLLREQKYPSNENGNHTESLGSKYSGNNDSLLKKSMDTNTTTANTNTTKSPKHVVKNNNNSNNNHPRS